MKKKCILLLGDSLGMPTGKDEITYEDTYPYLLSQKLNNFEVISRHRRTNDTSKQLVYQAIFDDIEMINSNYMVVHLGIVDCAPRVFSRFQNAAIGVLPNIITKHVLNFISKHRYTITRLFPKTYVSKQMYNSNLEKFVQISKEHNITLIFIEILQTSEANNRKSYNFKKNIMEYNKVLESIIMKYNIKLIKYDSKNYLLDDGIHITKEANMYLADEISKLIKEDKS